MTILPGACQNPPKPLSTLPTAAGPPPIAQRNRAPRSGSELRHLVQQAIYIVCICAAAIVAFILVDRAGQPDPIPMALKLFILVLALLALAHTLGYT